MGASPLTILGDVGLTTGNVRHDGDVRISGSVTPGSVVEVRGSVLILGEVRGAHVVAGGHLTVKGNVSGPDALLDAIGDVAVRQAADTRVIAGGDIRIEAAAERCELACGGSVRLPGPPGVIRGGTVKAVAGVEVRRAESSSGRPPRISVGGMPFDDGREQVALRLEFARKQMAGIALSSADSPVAYRRRVSTQKAYRHLALALERRLRQIRAAEGAEGPPRFLVSGEEPVDVVLDLGESRDVLRGLENLPEGGFVATLSDGELRIRPLKESIGVG